jgi:predicted ATPase
MMTQLRAKNFKSWADTGDLRLAPLTGFFGANSSGKTSLLQLLLMLKQTAESSDRRQVLFAGDKNSLVDLGTFYDLIHNHRSNAALELSLTWNLANQLIIQNPQTQNAPLYEIEVLQFSTAIYADKTPIVRSFSYKFGDHHFGMAQGDEPQRYRLETGSYKTRRVQGRAWPLPAPVKCYGFPDEAVGYFQNTGFLPELVLALEQMFSRVIYLGPLREYPQRQYVWAGQSPVDVGRRGEDAVAALLAARSENRDVAYPKKRGHRKKSIEQRVAEWLKEMGVIDSFSLEPIAENRKEYELRIRKTKDSAEVLITDVGFGVSQILPVLVLCYYVPEYSTIILEQPEIHLHPGVQSVLADVLIEVVRERNVQIIFESHSEHLLNRLQRRMAERQIMPEQVALYFCSMGGMASQIEALDIDEYGNIANWPKDFFGDSTGDLIAMTEAALLHQGSAPE